MEVQVIEENGIRKEIFTIIHNNLFLTATNQTKQIQITVPRRKVLKEETCQISHGNLLLLRLNHHLRPGVSHIEELAWLTSFQQLQKFYLEDCMAHFTLYCREPVKFLTKDDNYFVHQMQDPWCYEQKNFSDQVEDFARAYNFVNQGAVPIEQLLLQTQSLEDAWRKSYHSKPEIEDLIASGFLVISS